MMKVFYSETHQRHSPAFEVFEGGVRTLYLEMPERVERILAALRAVSWAEISGWSQSWPSTTMITWISWPQPGMNGS
jgi:hypothetical protein